MTAKKKTPARNVTANGADLVIAKTLAKLLGEIAPLKAKEKALNTAASSCKTSLNQLVKASGIPEATAVVILGEEQTPLLKVAKAKESVGLKSEEATISFLVDTLSAGALNHKGAMAVVATLSQAGLLPLLSASKGAVDKLDEDHPARVAFYKYAETTYQARAYTRV